MEAKPTIDETLKEAEEANKMFEGKGHQLKAQPSIDEELSDDLSSQDGSEQEILNEAEDDMGMTSAARKRKRGRSSGASRSKRKRSRSTKQQRAPERAPARSTSKPKRRRGRQAMQVASDDIEGSIVEVKKNKRGRPKAGEASASREAKHICKNCGGHISFNE